jgi:hypothetical protein
MSVLGALLRSERLERGVCLIRLSYEPGLYRDVEGFPLLVVFIDDPVLWLKDAEGIELKRESWVSSSIQIVIYRLFLVSVVTREAKVRSFIGRDDVLEPVAQIVRMACSCDGVRFKPSARCPVA